MVWVAPRRITLHFRKLEVAVMATFGNSAAWDVFYAQAEYFWNENTLLAKLQEKRESSK
jgi:hypothetical protein